MTQLCQYRGVLTRTHSITASQVLQNLPFLEPFLHTLDVIEKGSVNRPLLVSCHRHRHHRSLKARACLRTAKTSTWGKAMIWFYLSTSQGFSHGSSFSVLWQGWSTHGRSRPSNGSYGELVAVILLWISEKWRTGLNIQKRWGPGGTAWMVFQPSSVCFPAGVLSALFRHCFYRGKWCSGQCSSSPTGGRRLDRKWRRSAIGGWSFASRCWF